MSEEFKPSVIILSHGRSGSTLLLEFLAQDPDMWTAFEPLQAMRQMPPFLDKKRGGRCRDPLSPDASMRSACPHRDANIVLSLATCNVLPLLTTWYQDLELTGQRAAWVPHPRNQTPGYEWRTTAELPSLVAERTGRLFAWRHGCLKRRHRTLKTIRLNGHLQELFNISIEGEYPLPLVLHLVRDPKAVYASRKAINAKATAWNSQPGVTFLGIPRLSGTPAVDTITVSEWARALCAASRRDTAAGSRRGYLYERINFSELIYNPLQVTRMIYLKHLKRQIPTEVLSYITERLQRRERAKSGLLRSSHGVSDAHDKGWEGSFGTSARDAEQVEDQWKKVLAPWESAAIDAGCAMADD
jgi:hypothetical protein|tara:strand:+ start:452 stop:1522 length:1071 start_codon:yes stop_codon:yes gene_type:complete